jgi:TolA-binding protein
MKEEQLLKQLQTQISKIDGEVVALKLQKENVQRELELKVKTRKDLEKRATKIQSKKTTRVSEHAMLRYFERVKGFNLEEIEKEILNNKVLEMVDKLGGNGTYPNENGYRLTMKDSVVVTLTT